MGRKSRLKRERRRFKNDEPTTVTNFQLSETEVYNCFLNMRGITNANIQCKKNMV